MFKVMVKKKSCVQGHQTWLNRSHVFQVMVKQKLCSRSWLNRKHVFKVKVE